MRGVTLDLAAQVRDVHLAGVLVADVLARPEMLHELAARDDRFRLLGQQGQDLELRQGQVDSVAVDEHLVPAEVDLEAAELRTVAPPPARSSSRRRRIARTRLSSSALENGFVT